MVVRQDRLGLVAALNRGVSQARAPLIARLDADDVALPNRLARQLACFGRQKDLVLLGTWAERIDEAGHPTGASRPESDAGRLRAILSSRNPFIHSSVMFATEAVRACGGYRAALEAAEDFDLWLRLSERGAIAMLPESLVRYRVHPVGASTTHAVRQLFSARLAVRAAALRRSGRADPLDGQHGVPAWDGPLDDGEFADAARVARLLQYAGSGGGARPMRLDDVRAALKIPLTHRERKIAQQALLNLAGEIGRGAPLVRAELLARLFLLHPPRAMQLLFAGGH